MLSLTIWRILGAMKPSLFACILATLAVPAWAQLAPFKVQPVVLHDTTPISGMVEGIETAEARARIGGTLEAVRVARGAWVKKGQVLAVVRDAKLPQQSVGLQSQVEAAVKNLERMEALLPLDAASPAQVEQARAQWAALRAQAQNVNQNATDGAIRAPFNGQFVALHMASGTVVMPGESFGTVAAAPLRLKLRVPERTARTLAVGDALTLADDTTQPLGTGTITRLEAQAENGRVGVDVALPKAEPKAEDAAAPLTFRVGQPLVAMVPTGTRTGLAIPQTYLRLRNGLAFVTLKQGAEILVQPGAPRADGTLEILSGLTAGDEIVAP